MKHMPTAVAGATVIPAPSDEQELRWQDRGMVRPLPVTVGSEPDASWPPRTPSFTPIESAAPCLAR